MKKRIFVPLLVVIFAIIAITCSRQSLLIIQGQTMGTWYMVKVVGVNNENAREQIQIAIDRALSKVNTSLNTYDPNSEISHFNQYMGEDVFTSTAEFLKVTELAQSIYERSNGAFDPTVKDLVSLWGFGDEGLNKRPEIKEIEHCLQHVGLYKIRIMKDGILKKDPELHLDYSAIAKGYGVDVVMGEIALLGYEDILVEIGGEVKAKGKKWHIGIAVPDENNTGNKESAEIISLKDMSCATSGDYQQFYIENGERYSHLINPKTGYPIKHDVTSVTVIAESCMLADASATAAIVLGKTKGMDFIESLEGVEAFFIYREGDLLRSIHSSGWKW